MIYSTRLTRPFAPCAAILLVLMTGEAGAEPTIFNVRASQRPGTKLVDIDYHLRDASDPVTVRVRVSGNDGKTFAVPTTSLSGAFGAGMTTGTNKRITWNAGVDWNGKISPEMRFIVTTGPGEAKLSNRTYVDSQWPINRPPELKDSKRSSGRRYISFETDKQTLKRPDSGSVPIYLQLKVPEFAARNGGWGRQQVGLGCFYGMEISASGLFPDAKIYYKVGGENPGPRTRAKEWKPTSFNSIINIPLIDETYHFKIVLGSGVSSAFDKPLKVSASFKSARLCDASGSPITTLNSAGDLWVLTHGKNDGENSFRKMNQAVNAGAGPTQVASMDWASGASGAFFDLGAGRYFVNLGKNMAGLLKDQGFPGWKVHLVGHSWGANVGYETARSMRRVNRFVALDPAVEAPGYNDGRVDFAAVSICSTGIKGGDTLDGLFGSEIKTSTAHCSIRLFSNSHSGGDKNFRFYHSIPRDWFIRAMSSDSDVYWPFFKNQILRTGQNPDTPWNTNRRISGFDMEAHGKTSGDGGGQFLETRYIAFKGRGGQMGARAKAEVLGPPTWTYSRRHD